MQTIEMYPSKKGSGTSWVRVSEASKGKYGIITTKVGFIEVADEDAETLVHSLQSNELYARLGVRLSNGNYEVNVGEVTVAENAITA